MTTSSPKWCDSSARIWHSKREKETVSQVSNQICSQDHISRCSLREGASRGDKRPHTCDCCWDCCNITINGQKGVQVCCCCCWCSSKKCWARIIVKKERGHYWKQHTPLLKEETMTKMICSPTTLISHIFTLFIRQKFLIRKMQFNLFLIKWLKYSATEIKVISTVILEKTLIHFLLN